MSRRLEIGIAGVRSNQDPLKRLFGGRHDYVRFIPDAEIERQGTAGDLLVVAGDVGDDEWLKQAVHECQAPVLGIGSGFPHVVKALGGSMTFLSHRFENRETIPLKVEVPEHRLFVGIDEPRVPFNDRWALRNFPGAMVPLATSCYGTVIAEHPKRDVFGMHIDPTNKNLGSSVKMVRNLLDYIANGG